ncbi:MAG: response regulator [Actinobacteria bacterium]|nr:response regulator [Actinomycetota bacterium]
MKVLLVEDSPTQALRSRLALERHPEVEVFVATDGRAALEIAQRERPDVILSDILMPGMDGFQLCLEIRQHETLGSIPVVLQTASFLSEEDRVFALEAGADGYMEKDGDPDVLFDLMVEIASRGDRLPRSFSLDERAFRQKYGTRLVDRLVREGAELERANEALTISYSETLEALVAALDLRDTETELHSWRVAAYALALAERLGWDKSALDDLERGSILHDIGKIGIPDSILRKPGPLDEVEWVQMRTHPELGYRMVAHIGFLRGANEIILSHHEHWDGSGYPRGLKRDEIILGARIFAVADALDAITSNRPYRRARPFEVALAEVAAGSGTHFDPDLARIAQDITAAGWRAVREQVEATRAHIKAVRLNPAEGLASAEGVA